MRKYVAELLGTFGLVFCGTGAIIVNQEINGSITHAGIAITFGAIVMTMIYTFGRISGAHFNPAVSIAFAIARRFPGRMLLPYIVAQLSGAMLASIVLHSLFPGNASLGATIPSGSQWQSFVFEYILTFLLMMVIINVATGSREQGMFAGLAVGAAVMLEAMFAGPVCGASMNPARSIAPAVISGQLDSLWIYVMAPVMGAATAIPFWKYLTNTPDSHEDSAV